MTQEQLFLLVVVGAVAAVGYAISKLFVGKPADKAVERLRATPPPLPNAKSEPNFVGDLLHQIGAAAAKPFAPKTQEKQSAMRRKLGQGGIQSRAAIQAFIGAKVLFLVAGLGGGYFIGLILGDDLIGLVAGGMLGYLLPAIWLRLRIGGYQKSLNKGLPDALDLMVVCVEAGLTMEASMQRVGQELALAHPALAKELAVAHVETQMGVPRAEALRSVANRTGSAELKSLTAMLIQAEKLGTSIGRALRVHAESLRLKRQYAAQEMAAKASVKLIFPVAMLIFPAVITVLVGPAIIQMIESGFFRG
jgi:tight adherence protein C